MCEHLFTEFTGIFMIVSYNRPYGRLNLLNNLPALYIPHRIFRYLRLQIIHTADECISIAMPPNKGAVCHANDTGTYLKDMEAIITVVGFLGAGKTTLLKHLMTRYLDMGWNPFIILNDYENAHLDAQQFMGQITPKQIRALSGSCICCSGINELRDVVNRIPQRANGITLIEANGTSDACSLMSFLGVGLNDRFLPPVQISVVDVKNWQKREEHNELEANQIQVSSLIVLTHTATTPSDRLDAVIKELHTLNPSAEVMNMDEIDVTLIPKLSPSTNDPQQFEHLKAHWSSCSTDLPYVPDSDCIHTICNALPKSILRVKGCTQIGNEKGYTYFERTPDGKVRIRPFNGIPITGPKLLAIGPGSEPELLEKAIKIAYDPNKVPVK